MSELGVRYQPPDTLTSLAVVAPSDMARRGECGLVSDEGEH